MRCDFRIEGGIYLVQGKHKLDLHNDFDFVGLEYSVEERKLLLRWRRSQGAWVWPGTPGAVSVEFREVSEFRFQPRDASLPFTEDDCLHAFGYWTDEDWSDGVIPADANFSPEPSWLTALSFMSSAVVAVRAASAHAQIEP